MYDGARLAAIGGGEAVTVGANMLKRLAFDCGTRGGDIDLAGMAAIGAEARNDVLTVGPADGGAAWKSSKSSSTTKNRKVSYMYRKLS